MIKESTSRAWAKHSKLKRDKSFAPSPLSAGDEAYPNGIFEFNITQLLAFIKAHAERFPVESIAVADIPSYGAPVDEAAIRCANLSCPILMAEIAPERYNLIDGHHRLEKARRDAVLSVPARRLHCPEHVRFLTSTKAYETYVEYWNSKVQEIKVLNSRPLPLLRREDNE